MLWKRRETYSWRSISRKVCWPSAKRHMHQHTHTCAKKQRLMTFLQLWRAPAALSPGNECLMSHASVCSNLSVCAPVCVSVCCNHAVRKCGGGTLGRLGTSWGRGHVGCCSSGFNGTLDNMEKRKVNTLCAHLCVFLLKVFGHNQLFMPARRSQQPSNMGQYVKATLNTLLVF